MKENLLHKVFGCRKPDYNTSLYEYLGNDSLKKAAMVITNQQCAMAVGDYKNFEHSELKGILLNEIIDLNNKNNYIFLDEIITILIGPNDFIVSLPKNGKVSSRQFSALVELLYYVDACNRDNNKNFHDIKVFSNNSLYYDNSLQNIRVFFKELSDYVEEPKYFYNENIIGRDLLNEYERANLVVGYNQKLNNCKVLIKGYSSFSLVLLFSLFSTITFLILGVFIIIN